MRSALCRFRRIQLLVANVKNTKRIRNLSNASKTPNMIKPAWIVLKSICGGTKLAMSLAILYRVTSVETPTTVYYPSSKGLSPSCPPPQEPQ